jgi:hypothetical protein
MRDLGIYFSLAMKDAVSWARSQGRDAEIARVDLIIAAIDYALHTAEVEKVSLSQRVDDVLSRAAVTFGSGTDEYLEREPLNNHHQNLLAAEMSNGQQRLKELTTEITHFEFIKAALLGKFPDYKPPTTAGAAHSATAGGGRCADADP